MSKFMFVVVFSMMSGCLSERVSEPMKVGTWTPDNEDNTPEFTDTPNVGTAVDSDVPAHQVGEGEGEESAEGNTDGEGDLPEINPGVPEDPIQPVEHCPRDENGRVDNFPCRSCERDEECNAGNCFCGEDGVFSCRGYNGVCGADGLCGTFDTVERCEYGCTQVGCNQPPEPPPVPDARPTCRANEECPAEAPYCVQDLLAAYCQPCDHDAGFPLRGRVDSGCSEDHPLCVWAWGDTLDSIHNWCAMCWPGDDSMCPEGQLCRLSGECVPEADVHEDWDSDGITAEDGDCNDHDERVHPGFPEFCNGIDDNCDGVVDNTTDLDCIACQADGECPGDHARFEGCDAHNNEWVGSYSGRCRVDEGQDTGFCEYFTFRGEGQCE